MPDLETLFTEVYYKDVLHRLKTIREENKGIYLNATNYNCKEVSELFDKELEKLINNLVANIDLME